MSFIEAAPQYKVVNLYDDNLKRLPREAVEQFIAPSVAKGVGQERSARKEVNGKEVAQEVVKG